MSDLIIGFLLVEGDDGPLLVCYFSVILVTKSIWSKILQPLMNAAWHLFTSFGARTESLPIMAVVSILYSALRTVIGL